MPRIENELAVVEVKTQAAEITSFYDKEKNIEHMWQGDPQFWAGRNPILFPMVGSTWTKDYQIDGKTMGLLATVNSQWKVSATTRSCCP